MTFSNQKEVFDSKNRVVLWGLKATSLVVDCKSSTLGFISLSLYKFVLESYKFTYAWPGNTQVSKFHTSVSVSWQILFISVVSKAYNTCKNIYLQAFVFPVHMFDTVFETEDGKMLQLPIRLYGIAMICEYMCLTNTCIPISVFNHILLYVIFGKLRPGNTS